MQEIISDEELMRRFVVHDDLELFEELVERHKDNLVRYATRYLRNFHRAEEVVQETFVRIFEHRLSFKAGSQFQPWLFTILNNICRNELRKRHELPLDPTVDLSTKLAGPDTELLRVQHAMQRLPEVQREALLLYAFHDKSYEEISIILGAPLNTVRSWVRRGRLAIIQTLEATHHEL